MNPATSLYLDLVRPLAAFIVLLSHVSLINLSGGRLAAFADAGAPAVDVFFVLSGFVIAHVCATRERDWTTYAISRVVRIASVAFPAILLTVLADALGLWVNPAAYTGPYQAIVPGLVARSLLFLGEQWNAHRYPGTNGPYWSLGFEVWYYVAFGVLVFAPRRLRWGLLAAVLAFIGPKVAVLFPLWLMGVAAYRALRHVRPRPAAGWGLMLTPVLLMAACLALPSPPLQAFWPVTLTWPRLWALGQDYLVGLLFSTHLLGFAMLSDRFAPWLDRHARVIRWIAGATFSLYLAHLPIMHLLSALSPWANSSDATLWLMLTVTPLLCYAFAEISERRKSWWRARMLDMFGVVRSLRLGIRHS